MSWSDTKGGGVRAPFRARSQLGRKSSDVHPVRWPAWPVTVLIVTLIVPWLIELGPTTLSLYRIALLVLTVPCLLRWTSGRAGRVRAPDILFILYSLWCVIALAVVHGPNFAFETGTLLFIETFIAYLVGRCYIRSAADFRAAVKVLFLAVVALLPFAVLETITTQKVMLDLFAQVLPTVPITGNELRLGFMRVQGPFDHPILFGVFCGGIVALTHGVLGRGASTSSRWLMTGLVVVTATLSWSSGPILSIAVQIALLAWNFVLRNVPSRWRIIWAIALSGYLLLEIVSEQPVAQLLTRFAFDPWTAYYRLLIWDNGWKSIFLHPLFGTGFGEWVRPAWMPPSIDMFWIVPAIRHGLPALIFYMAACIWIVLTIGFSPMRGGETADYRTAFLISFASFALAGCTVHFWNATYVLFMFLLGSGMWILDAPEAEDRPADPPGRRRRLPRSRAA